MTTGEFPGLHEAASRSRIVGAAAAVIRVLAMAAGSCAMGRWIANGRAAFVGLGAGERLRWSAMTLGWAGLFYWAGLAVVPPYTATGLPRLYFLALAGAAWLTAVNAETVARAWPASRVARIVRWLVT